MVQIAVALHLWNYQMLPEFQGYLQNISQAGHAFDLFVSVPDKGDRIKSLYPNARIVTHENRGFDIGGFFAVLPLILQGRYDYVLKLHSKSSPRWRRELIEPICGSPYRVEHCLQKLQDPHVGMVGSEAWLIDVSGHWGVNHEHMLDITKKWNTPLSPCKFIGGTIFWMKHSVLKESCARVNLPEIVRELNTESSLDWNWYLMSYPDLRRNGVRTKEEALQHWEENGRKEGRACNCIPARTSGGRFVCDGMVEHAYERFFGMLIAHRNLSLYPMSTLSFIRNIRFLALYYPPPDWNKIKRGPVQPHLDLGYYHPRNPINQSYQISLLQRGGIYGLCYTDPTTTLPGIPFCIQWKGTPHRFTDPNYIKIDDKPLIYSQDLITPFHLSRTNRITVTVSGSVEEFRKTLINAVQQAIRNGDQYIFLKSFNHWESGQVLEPTQKDNYRFLDELQSVQRYFN